LLRRIGRAEPNDPESFTDYFRLLYQLSVPDECLIQKERAKLHFEQVDELFKFIDDNTFPVLVLSQRISGVPDDSSTPAAEVYEAARRRGFFVREDWRRLQPFLINLLQSSHSRPPFNEFISPAFDSESGLWIWTGTYLGGLDGVGIAPLGTEDYIV
jgi:CRISPR-associated endonuclease/helicase Cas3